MNCREIQNRIDLEFGIDDSNLPNDLKAHIEGCPDCKAYFEELLRLNQLLGNSHDNVLPGELDDITFERIAGLAKLKNNKARKIFQLKWAWIPAAAAALIIGILFAPQLIHKSPPATAEIYTADYSTTDSDLETALLSSDTLTDQFLSTMASKSSDLDQADEELLGDSNINEMINNLSDKEIDALYKRLENLKG